jgi:hypothetical protein
MDEFFAPYAMGAVESAGQQLAIRLAWRAERRENREEYASALSDYESAVSASPEDEAMRQELLEFNQRRLDANPDESPSASK